jgi:hypothetical protein
MNEHEERYIKYLNKTGGNLGMLKGFASAAAKNGATVAKRAAVVAKKGIDKAEKIKIKCHETLTPIIEELNKEKETYGVLFNLAIRDKNISYDKILKYLTRVHIILGFKMAELSSKKNMEEMVKIIIDIRCIVLKVKVKKLRKKSDGLAEMVVQLKKLLNKIVDFIKMVYGDDNDNDKDMDFDCKK